MRDKNCVWTAILFLFFIYMSLNTTRTFGLRTGNNIADLVYPRSSIWHSETGREFIDTHCKLADPLILIIIVKLINLTGRRAAKLRFKVT
jgi:hypothetical protein